MADCISSQGGGVLTMDVSVLGGPGQPCDIEKNQVAAAGGSSISSLRSRVAMKNTAMQIMAKGWPQPKPLVYIRRRVSMASSS